FPFYFAQAGPRFFASNALNALFSQADVDRELNEIAIADCLLFDSQQEAEATAYRAIRRLPPAHCLSIDAAGMKIWRYWRMETIPEIRFRREEEYVEQFRELLAESLRDRLRDTRASI